MKHPKVEAVELLEEAGRMNVLLDRLRLEGSGWDDRSDTGQVRGLLERTVDGLEALAGLRLVAHTKELLKKP